MKAQAVQGKKPYYRPEARKLAHEQAALLLLGHAWEGNKNAKMLLELAAEFLFPAPSRPKKGE
jgi:hypothetical protein